MFLANKVSKGINIFIIEKDKQILLYCPSTCSNTDKLVPVLVIDTPNQFMSTDKWPMRGDGHPSKKKLVKCHYISFR